MSSRSGWPDPPEAKQADGGEDAPEAGEPPGLIFAPEPRSRGALTTMLGLSLLGHAISFYILQVYYAPAVALPPSPPPVRWTLLPPGSPEGEALARWLAVSDPALVAGARAPSPERVLAGLPPATAYVPSYAALATVGNEAASARLPVANVEDEAGAGGRSMFPPGPAPTPAGIVPAPRHVASAEAPAPRTRVDFSENLRGRLPADSLDAAAGVRLAHHAATLAEVLRPAEFLVGVRPEGGAPVVFCEESSGTAVADDAARACLETLPFTPLPTSPRGGDLVWGRVTFRWGVDAYR